MKPMLARSDDPRVRPMIFYGYDPALEMKPEAAPAKKYDGDHRGETGDVGAMSAASCCRRSNRFAIASEKSR